MSRVAVSGRVASKRGGNNFGPSDFAPNCGLYLRADAGFDGTTWTDQTGHARNPTNATPSKRPIAAVDGSGRAVLRFDGASNKWLAFNDATVCTSYTVMACFAYDATLPAADACIIGNRPWGNGAAQTVSLFGLDSPHWPLMYQNSASANEFFAPYDFALTQGTPHIVTWVVAGGRRKTFVDGFQLQGELVDRTNLSTRAFAQFIGGEDGAAQFGGDIYRLAVWDRNLNPWERSVTEQLWRDELVLGDGIGRIPYIVFDGDSITQAISPGLSTFVADVEALLAAAPAAPTHRTVNLANSGQTIAQMIDNAPYQLSVAPFAPHNILILDGGHNDLASTGSAATTLARTNSYVARARGMGFRVLVGEVLPGLDIVAAEAERLSLNASLFATYGADTIRLGTDPDMGQTGQYTNLTYYRVDQVHPNATGNARMATYVAPRVKDILAGIA